MDMSHRGFVRDHQLARSSSGMTTDLLHQATHAEQFERVLIQRLETGLVDGVPLSMLEREGFLLASAILFGALIDQRSWRQWMLRSRGIMIDATDSASRFHRIGSSHPKPSRSIKRKTPQPRKYQDPSQILLESINHRCELPRLAVAGRAWVDLDVGTLRNDRSIKIDRRRWVADPMTQLLLCHWQDERLDHADKTIDAGEALAAAFRIAPSHENLAKIEDILAQAATAKWRFRMPSFIIDAIGPSGTCVSIASERWAVLLGRTPTPLILDKPKLDKPRKSPAKASSNLVLDILRDALPENSAATLSRRKGSSKQIELRAGDSELQPVEVLVLRWSATRLCPERYAIHRNRRLAPSTIIARASALVAFLFKAFGNKDPRRHTGQQFLEILNASVRLPKASIRPSDLDCFADWMNRSHPHLALIWEHPGPSNLGGVTADIITKNEYDRLLARFDRHTMNGAMTRLLVVLGFRAGLRWSEAANLQIADLDIIGDHVELCIRSNSDRKLKSAAGRRLLPLHLLLDEAEQRELLDWWHDRRATAAACLPGDDPDPQNRRRLFPHYGSELMPWVKLTLNQALREETGNPKSDYHMFRHSCGSYLLSTLALPIDVPDDQLQPAIDPSLVSHVRRRRLSPLLGHSGRDGINAVHAVGAILGHSGETATLRSYMHLHDWLACIYTSRPAVQAGASGALAGMLLGMSAEAAERASRRQRFRRPTDATALENIPQRGRPRGTGQRGTGSVILAPLIDRKIIKPVGAPVRDRPPEQSGNNRTMPLKAMLTLLLASSDEQRVSASRQRAFRTPAGRELLTAIEAILSIRTRGRGGVDRPRFHNPMVKSRRFGVREQNQLERLLHGLMALPTVDQQMLCSQFLAGHDPARRSIRVSQNSHARTTQNLERAGFGPVEVVLNRQSAILHLANRRLLYRPTLWALVILSALHFSKISAFPSNHQRDL